jgi:hypothetical protein
LEKRAAELFSLGIGFADSFYVANAEFIGASLGNANYQKYNHSYNEDVLHSKYRALKIILFKSKQQCPMAFSLAPSLFWLHNLPVQQP